MSKRSANGSQEPPKLPQKSQSVATAITPQSEGPSTAAYVDYALDMMAHNLVSAGKLDPRKGSQLKTDEMRSQIRARLDAMQKSLEHQTISKEKRLRPSYSKIASGGGGGGGLPVAKPKRWAVQPNALPIAIITDKKPRDEDFPSQKSKRKTKFLGKASIGVGVSISYAANLHGSRSSAMSKSGVAVPLKTAVQFQKIPVNRGRSRSVSVTKSIASKQNLSKSKEQLIPSRKTQIAVSTDSPKPKETKRSKDIFVKRSTEPKRNKDASAEQPTDNKPSLTVQGRRLFRASLDMKGFLNEEISLDLDGHKLTVTGIRGKREDLNARRVTETLELPVEVNVDRLKIARRADGFLILQESTQAPSL